MRASKILAPILVLVSFSIQTPGKSPPRLPWPEIQQHLTFFSFPSDVSDDEISVNCAEEDKVFHCVWPSWNGTNFDLAYATMTEDRWSEPVIFSKSPRNKLSPSVVVVNQKVVGVYRSGSNLRFFRKSGDDWNNEFLAQYDGSELLSHQEHGYIWWTWVSNDRTVVNYAILDSQGGTPRVYSLKVGDGGIEETLRLVHDSVIG